MLQEKLLSLLDAVPDSAVTETIFGNHVLAVQSRRTGLATWAVGDHPVARDPVCDRPRPAGAKDLARWLMDENPAAASIGLAALNSLLPVPAEQVLEEINAGDLILQYAENKNIAVIGHFPFVAKLRSRFSNLWVLEKSPKPGDFPAAAAPEFLPQADVVALTATTLANRTLSECLRWTRSDAVKFIIGPSTPLTPLLFDVGFDVLAGSLVADMDQVRRSILANKAFKEVAGVRHVVWRR